MSGGDLALSDSRIRLPDGRTIAYAEYGVPDGRPVIYLHGTPGTRLEHPRAIMAGAAGTRIISVERPGYGYSDFSTEGGMLEWADDVADLASALGIERFAVVGPSGGAPYAATCAYRLPTRVTAAGLVSSPAPLPVDRHPDGKPTDKTAGLSEAAEAARRMSLPDFLAWFTEHRGGPPPDEEQILASIVEGSPDWDKPVVALPEVQASLRFTFQEAFRQGVKGWARDTWIRSRPWGFRLEDIAVPTYLWHGELDDVVPVEDARYLVRAIPNCQATFYADRGHWLPPSCWEDVYAALV